MWNRPSPACESRRQTVFPLPTPNIREAQRIGHVDEWRAKQPELVDSIAISCPFEALTEYCQPDL